ncbi:MAG: hypothetical protein KAJ49_10510 [Arcobacteraceae bacterium]|nr:hypothetical protein [Arcobacteraceae bacterium]
MIIEDFSYRLISSKMMNTYVATAFFSTVIFFVLNANSYTPLEMITGIILATIAFKGVANMMLSLVILLFNLDNKGDALEFEQRSAKVNGLLNELSLQQTKIKSNQLVKG